MKEHLQRLRELQELDLEKDSLQERVDLLRNKLAEHTELLERLSGALEDQRKQLEDTRALRGAKQTELKESKDRLHQAKEKFHNVTNGREYAAAEREIESFKAIVSQSQEEITQLTSAIEEAEASISQGEEKISALRQDLNIEEGGVNDAERDVHDRSAFLTRHRVDLSKAIRRDVLMRYEFIRSRRPGKAIVPAVDGACTGCFMRIPPQLYIELQRGMSLETCQNCQRILYYPEEEELAQLTSETA